MTRPVLKKIDIDNLDERNIVHPFNEKAIINMKSVGDAAGLTGLGIHLLRIAPGDETTAPHNHEMSEEFVYVLSGRAALFMDGEEQRMEAGDFAGFTAGGPAHYMKNDGDRDLVFLVGGTRPATDVINQPGAGKRMYSTGGRLDVVDTADIRELKPGK